MAEEFGDQELVGQGRSAHRSERLLDRDESRWSERASTLLPVPEASLPGESWREEPDETFRARASARPADVCRETGASLLHRSDRAPGTPEMLKPYRDLLRWGFGVSGGRGGLRCSCWSRAYGDL